jgi:hypothetical protein
MPNPGKMRIYTSGCPKNQKRCMNKIGSPPPTGSKKAVPTFRSISSIVKPDPSTGIDLINRKDVTIIEIKNKATWCMLKFFGKNTTILVRKFRAPEMDEIPAICSLKMIHSTEHPGWPIFRVRGGYKVHPAPTPPSILLDNSIRAKDLGIVQNLNAFRRPKTISGAPNIIGIIQFPKNPIIKGITAKKIIIRP